MASLDILYFNPFSLKNKIMKIEHKKIFGDPSKILKNIPWPINICLKYFMPPQKPSSSPSYIFNVQSLMESYTRIKTTRRFEVSVPNCFFAKVILSFKNQNSENNKMAYSTTCIF